MKIAMIIRVTPSVIGIPIMVASAACLAFGFLILFALVHMFLAQTGLFLTALLTFG